MKGKVCVRVYYAKRSKILTTINIIYECKDRKQLINHSIVINITFEKKDFLEPQKLETLEPLEPSQELKTVQ